MYFWGLVKKVVQQVENLSFFLLFLLFYKKVKKSEKKYKKVFSTFPDGGGDGNGILLEGVESAGFLQVPTCCHFRGIPPI